MAVQVIPFAGLMFAGNMGFDFVQNLVHGSSKPSYTGSRLRGFPSPIWYSLQRSRLSIRLGMRREYSRVLLSASILRRSASCLSVWGMPGRRCTIAGVPTSWSVRTRQGWLGS
jgi:hypothetical protein